jgi:hypothetical protein
LEPDGSIRWSNLSSFSTITASAIKLGSVEDSGLLIPCFQVETYPSTDRNYVKTLLKVINAINLPNIDKMMKAQKKLCQQK